MFRNSLSKKLTTTFIIEIYNKIQVIVKRTLIYVDLPVKEDFSYK